MQLTIGEQVRVWDDDRARWRDGEITALFGDEAEVTVRNGDHPRHPWQAEAIEVPLEPAFVNNPTACGGAFSKSRLRVS